tara:strand:- start:2680 stop:3618 length:939 start_codon:yes stop_codon:yes gene_type:complete
MFSIRNSPLLVALLVFPALLVWLGQYLWQQTTPSSDMLQLPATSAGSTIVGAEGSESFDPSDIPSWSGDASERNLASSDSRLIIDKDFIVAGESVQLRLQIPQFRFRRSEPLAAFLQISSASPDAIAAIQDVSLRLTTEQGNTLRDITPPWTHDTTRLHGMVSVLPDDSWPDRLQIVATVITGGQQALRQKADIELFSPAATITGTEPAYLKDDEWLIPVTLLVNQRGVVSLSSSLTEETGALITHLNSREHMTASGTMLIHVRSSLITPSHLKTNLVLRDLQVRLIPDRQSAPLGIGDSVQPYFVLAPFQP